MLPELTNYLNKQLLKRKNRPTSTLLAAKTSLPLQDQRPSPCLHQLHPNPFFGLGRQLWDPMKRVFYGVALAAGGKIDRILFRPLLWGMMPLLWGLMKRPVADEQPLFRTVHRSRSYAYEKC